MDTFKFTFLVVCVTGIALNVKSQYTPQTTEIASFPLPMSGQSFNTTQIFTLQLPEEGKPTFGRSVAKFIFGGGLGIGVAFIAAEELYPWLSGNKDVNMGTTIAGTIGFVSGLSSGVYLVGLGGGESGRFTSALAASSLSIIASSFAIYYAEDAYQAIVITVPLTVLVTVIVHNISSRNHYARK